MGRVPQNCAGEASSVGELRVHAVSGPMARSVPDLALFLDAMAHAHPRCALQMLLCDHLSLNDSTLHAGIALGSADECILAIAVDNSVANLVLGSACTALNQGC